MKNEEQLGLLPTSTTPLVYKEEDAAKPRVKSIWYRITVAVAIWFFFVHIGDLALIVWDWPPWEVNSGEICQQVPALVPETHSNLSTSLGRTFDTDVFKQRAVELLSGAVKIPTESYDSMDPVGVDPRWEVFAPFHDYLLKAFPLIHTTLELTKVNTYGLVYVWKGSDTSLKPVLFAAHQDVVPVHPSTVDQWNYPPYSGHFDGSRIWGRGSSDDKSGLIGVMTSIESLLENRFEPTRGVVLAFGFDEEASGLHGAQYIAKYLEDTYGHDVFAFMIDEGAGFYEQFGAVIATPGIAEKGYVDIELKVTAPGGHSSVPPEHTSIGILSALLVKLENNPIKPILARNTPVYDTIKCLAAHAPELPQNIRKTVKRSVTSDFALREAERYFFQSQALKSLAGTTQAIDLIGGGVKINALPEEAWAVVNHRVATDSSLEALKDRDTSLLKDLAREFNLKYTAFGEYVLGNNVSASGTLTISEAFAKGLKPAPITPTEGDDAAPYRLLSGTIKATYNAHRSIEGESNVAVSPGIMSGNTDTRYYWNLTRHIFRYNHQNGGTKAALSNGVHTVNEWIDADAFVEIIRFFTTLILNADERAF